MTYYVKVEDKIYRFSSWSDIENLSGKDRKCYGRMKFYKAIKTIFKNYRIIGKWSAVYNGWIDSEGAIVPPFLRGNY